MFDVGEDSVPKQVTIHTDGACIGNPGPGGYGVVLEFGEHRRELSGGFRCTTNNRMELRAVVEGLRALKAPCDVTLFSDSLYVVKAMTQGWARRWQSNGWRLKGSGKALNRDLWAEVLRLCDVHEVEFRWVKGHAGNRDNERCDALAVAAAQSGDLAVDAGYERDETGQRELL